MAAANAALEEQRKESDSLEKGIVHESSDINAEEPLGSGDSGLTTGHVVNKDDPLVCFITIVLSCLLIYL